MGGLGLGLGLPLCAEDTAQGLSWTELCTKELQRRVTESGDQEGLRIWLQIYVPQGQIRVGWRGTGTPLQLRAGC